MYVCALRPAGEPVSMMDVFGYIARMRRDDGAIHSIVEGPFAAIALDRPGQHRPLLARWHGLIGAGDVRLDNRAEVASLAGVDAAGHTDLELVLAAIDRSGEGCMVRLLGDFAFVCWDARAQKLLAVRDAFGVKPLYQRTVPGLELFASDVDPLRQDDAYDLDYIATFLAADNRTTNATIWRDVTAVGAGSVVRQRGTVQSSERYWSAAEFAPADGGDEEGNCVRFRELLEESISARMDDPARTWAQLSGGLDSSSIVSLANRNHGLTNTITIVDGLGEGDEREYSTAVVRRYQLRNETVHDFCAWQDDGEAPPSMSEPWPLYPFFARDRRMWNIVNDGGGRVLLSGLGSDHYLNGNLDYVTDLAARGHIRDALGEVTEWSIALRTSFWTVGRRLLVDPLLSRGRPAMEPSPWVTRNAIPTARGAAPAMGSRFAGRIVEAIDTLPAWMERPPIGPGIEMRYPFLYRPLVEHSLQLPVRQRIQPNESKRVLRSAMRDVLPEQVRTRVTKGGIDARILWSLHREKPRLDAMLRDPILAQLGCVDAALLRQAADDARRGLHVNIVQLFTTLALETWLAVRNGAWAEEPWRTVTAA